MPGSNLSVAITADIVDLQTKCGVAKAEVSALTAEFNKLAKQSAAGLLDPAGLGELQEASRALLEARNAARELQEQFKSTHEASVNLGEGLSEIRSQISSAFEVTGIAAAFEAVKSVGEAVEQLGERAIQIRSMSEVLGVTSSQFQAMSVAAEEAGVSAETFTRAGERLENVLNEARNGSGAAVEKLRALGVATYEIADPTFKLNDLFGVLKERLTNTATEEETHNELLQILGTRTAIAIAAIKEYDGSLAGVAKVMAAIHGQTDEEIKQLAESKAAYDRLWTSIKNITGSYLAMAEAAKSGGGIDPTSRIEALTGNTPKAPPKAESGTEAEDARVAARLKGANDEIAAIQLVTKADLEADKDAIASTKQGTTERLAAVQQYALQAAAFYGQNVDKVREADRQVIAEARASNEELIREASKAAAKEASLRAEQVRATIKLDDEAAKARLAGIKLSIDANNQYLASEVKTAEFYRSVETMNLEIQTHIYRERAKTSAQMNALVQKETREQLAEWQFLTNGMKQGFDQAIRGMLNGTENFGQAMRGIFTSVFDAIIAKLAEWAAEWITQHLIALATSKAIATDEVITAAGIAAVNAMASVAAIPLVGWIMAPEVGAATYAEALAIGIPKAAGGWDIPQGLNPVAQLHAGEMVLPRPIADTVRNATQQGGSGVGGGRRHDLNIKYTPVGNSGILMTRDSLTQMLKDLHYSFAG